MAVKNKAPEARQDLLLLKLGGRALEQPRLLQALASELKALLGSFRIVLVHGGGREVTELSERLGLKPVFQDGIRITSEAEMDIVEMVLCGKVNKDLVRRFNACGLPAVGLCGADGRLFLSESLGEVGGLPTRTGRISSVDPRLLETLMATGFLPLLAPNSADEGGGGININADTVALELACALRARILVFLSDTPGILKEGSVLPELDETRGREEIRGGAISGGMIPKVVSALEALKRGVGRIIIGQYTEPGALAGLLDGSRGTRIRPGDKERGVERE